MRAFFKNEVKTMDFLDIAKNRQSCRKYDATRAVEREKIDSILEAARLCPSACNGQPYHFTVCTGKCAREVAKLTQEMGMNKFASDAPVLIVISEKPYVKSAAVGAKFTGNDYRSIDIGIAAAYITAQAHTLGLGSCILGWFNNDKLKALCNIKEEVRLVITIGYPNDDTLRTKKRKDLNELVSFAE